MRHPLIVGNVLISVGVAVFADHGLGLILIPVALVLLYRFTVPFEEARLAERFGARYAEYRARVPLVPRPRPAVPENASSKTSWRFVVEELPIIAGALVLAALAEGVGFIPHLLEGD